MNSLKQEDFFKALAQHVPEDEDDDSDSCESCDYSDSEEEEENEEDRQWAKDHIVEGDEEWEEEWTRSDCPCNVCQEMNAAVDEWEVMKANGSEDPLAKIVANGIDNMVGHIIHQIDDEHFKRGRQTPKL